MIGSDSIDSVGETDDRTGWGVVAEYDGAAALVDALLDLDPATEYTKTELSDEAGVAYKSLYLSGTVEALADAGLLERTATADGEEATFSVDPDSPAYDAAAAFAEAIERHG